MELEDLKSIWKSSDPAFQPKNEQEIALMLKGKSVSIINKLKRNVLFELAVAIAASIGLIIYALSLETGALKWTSISLLLMCLAYSIVYVKKLLLLNRFQALDGNLRDTISLYSEYSRKLYDTDHDLILQQYYYPHRNGVEELIAKAAKPVVHLSIHSFTPVFNGHKRVVDVGLLFDPDRNFEAAFCARLLDGLEHVLPRLVIKFNEPYKGTDDGFTTYLRTKFDDREYLGIEVEVNQKYLGTEKWEMIAMALKDVLAEVLYDPRS